MRRKIPEGDFAPRATLDPAARSDPAHGSNQHLKEGTTNVVPSFSTSAARKTPAARRRGLLTDASLRAIQPGTWLTEPAPRGAGVLQARLSGAAVRFYYRYANATGQRERMLLGRYDRDGRAGLTLAQARALAGAHSRQYQLGDRRLREGAVRQAQAKQRSELAERDAQKSALEAASVRASATLGELCESYADYLLARGKSSAHKARACMRRWVRDRWPALWGTPAAAVTPTQVVDILLPLVEQAKPRTANMVRGHLRAAYGLAVSARLRADAPPALRRLGLESNPVRDVMPVAGGNRARDRALTVAELRAYWRCLAERPDRLAGVLRVHLLTGAQRFEQLARATVEDIDPDAHAMRLRDPKGRRTVPRDHWVPLTMAAEAAIAALRGATVGAQTCTPSVAAGPFLLSLTGGRSGADYARVRRELASIAAQLLARGEVSARFTLGDLRRTVETRLAEARVPADVRAHLQSHGLGGVQSRHYDRYDRAPEVRAALETLHRIVTGTGAIVRPFRRRA